MKNLKQIFLVTIYYNTLHIIITISYEPLIVNLFYLGTIRAYTKITILIGFIYLY